jgi:hypothetical protein
VVRTGKNAGDVERRERIDELFGLAAAALVERTQAVFSLPLGAVAGARVPD